jgi:hypothetical protein
MNSSKNRNRLYNFLVNTYGLTKEVVMEMVAARLDDLISKHIKPKLDSNHVNNIIRNQIAEYAKNGFEKRGYWGSHTSFEEFVQAQIRTILIAYINENYDIDTKLVKKEAKVVSVIKVEKK